MKTAIIPQVRVEHELRGVEYRLVQTDFAARCNESLAAYERTGVSTPSDKVLSKLEAKVAARVKQLRNDVQGRVHA